MIERTISLRYARALLQLASETNSVDQYGQELVQFCILCDDNKELFNALSTSGFGHVNRLNVLNAVLEKTSLQDNVKNFLRVIVRKSRVVLLTVICAQYLELADQAMGRCQMKVTSSVELPNEQYENLSKLFSERVGQKMVLTKRVDPTVLGGVKVQIGDKVFDYTISRQLQDMKERMLAS